MRQLETLPSARLGAQQHGARALAHQSGLLVLTVVESLQTHPCYLETTSKNTQTHPNHFKRHVAHKKSARENHFTTRDGVRAGRDTRDGKRVSHQTSNRPTTRCNLLYGQKSIRFTIRTCSIWRTQVPWCLTCPGARRRRSCPSPQGHDQIREIFRNHRQSLAKLMG